VNGFEETDDDTLEFLPDTTLENFHQLPEPEIKSLATEPRKHLSAGCEEFYANCTKKLLNQPLEAQFHFCAQTKENCKRKRCRSLNLSTRSDSPLSCSSGNCSPCDKKLEFLPDSKEDQVYEPTATDGFKRMRVTSPVFEECQAFKIRQVYRSLLVSLFDFMLIWNRLMRRFIFFVLFI